jgi:hypothetical protein
VGSLPLPLVVGPQVDLSLKPNQVPCENLSFLNPGLPGFLVWAKCLHSRS